MVILGTIPDHRAAKALCDYLKLKNIDNRIEARPSQIDAQVEEFAIYVDEENKFEAQSIFLDFVQDPTQKKFHEASWLVGQIDDSVAKPYNKIVWTRTGPFTKVVTFLCSLIFVLSYFGLFGPIRQALGFEWQITEFYRFFTPAFLHFSLMHLAFNLAIWWFLAGRIERLLGTKSLLAIFLISAAVSNISQAAIVHTSFGGLSGVNYALVGFAWYCGAVHKSNTLFLPNNIFGFMIVWMLLGFADVLPVAMANWAHLMGLVSGLVLAHVMVKKSR